MSARRSKQRVKERELPSSRNNWMIGCVAASMESCSYFRSLYQGIEMSQRAYDVLILREGPEKDRARRTRADVLVRASRHDHQGK